MKDVKQNTLKEEKIFNFLKKNNDFVWHLSLYEELESTNDHLIAVSYTHLTLPTKQAV